MASIASIQSIGHRDATRLRKANVRTTEALLARAATRRGRSEVSERTGISTANLLKWAQQADVMRISGVGSEYADLLASVGVETIKVLRRRNAENLVQAMTQINTRRRRVQRLPTVEMIEGWIRTASELDSIVTS